MPRFVRRGLRVLMYHRTSAARGDDLTVTTAQLREQVAWLRAEGFAFVTLAAVIRACAGRAPLPARAVAVTFDDATSDTHALAWPVLRELGVGAAVFVPTAFIGRTTEWDRVPQAVMTVAQLRELAGAGWELGLHSHRHRSFDGLTPVEIADDTRACGAALAAAGLAPVPAIAYPFGHRPAARGDLAIALASAGVQLGFRIGGRINAWPPRDQFDLNRLVVRGDESFAAFRRKVQWGRLW